MSGAKRSADTLNTIGIVVVGVCGAVLVYVTITALQAFYVNDTSDIQTMADYGGQDMPVKNLRAQQMGSINEYGTNPAPAPAKAGETQKLQTYRMPITDAKKKVAEEAKHDASNLVPAVGPSDHPSVLPIFGRPKPIPGAAPAAGSGSGSDAAPLAPTGNGSADAGAGSAKGNAP